MPATAGHVSIEYAGKRSSEQADIARTRQLLERVSARLAPVGKGVSIRAPGAEPA